MIFQIIYATFKESLEFFNPTIEILTRFSGYWLPIVLFAIFIQSFRLYTRAFYISTLKWTTLEIKIPREIRKSPQAMELVLAGLHQTAEGTWLDRFWKGRTRSWFSLEMVSIGGKIHFFIYTQSFFKDLVEARIYSQYPEIEIHEVDDYTRRVPYRQQGSDWDLFGFELKFEKKDAYPIKSYIDYGMDKSYTDDEDQKIDPMTPVLELMGTLKGSEQMWIQILIESSGKRLKHSGHLWKRRTWQDEADELIKKLSKKDIKTPIKPIPGQYYEDITLTSGERNVIEAIERNVDKFGFDSGIRLLYLAKKKDFNPISFVAMIGVMKQYNSAQMNGFKPNWKFGSGFEYPWQDFRGVRMKSIKRRLFNSYLKRSYFHSPHKRIPMTLSVEEIATIYHFPGKVSETPTLGRIPSKTSEPPANLPV